MWLPGVERVLIYSKLGKALLGTSHQLPVRKLLWHTTEGSSIAGALGAYRARRGWRAGVHPHLTVDPKREAMVQHVPLDNASYSVRDRSDRRGVIQVEVVGNARDTDLWPDEWYEWLGHKVAGPIVDHHTGIDINNWRQFYDEESGLLLASARSPVRLSDNQFDLFSGQLGHQHAPAPDTHWDPGEWRPEVIARACWAELNTEAQEGDEMKIINDAESQRMWLTWVNNGTTHVREYSNYRGAGVGESIPGAAFVIEEQTDAGTMVQVN